MRRYRQYTRCRKLVGPIYALYRKTQKTENLRIKKAGIPVPAARVKKTGVYMPAKSVRERLRKIIKATTQLKAGLKVSFAKIRAR